MNAPQVPPAVTVPALAVDITGLNKIYRASGKRPPHHALIDVDLKIPRGALFGLLGPNGAGKSTLINILAGLVLKTSGKVLVWGIDLDRDPRSARGAIGVVPQEINIDGFFTPRETLDIQAGLYGVPKSERRTDEILAAVNLAAQANAHARTLSGGMRRRLLVAKALVHRPPVLVLDEPTAGVDVQLRQLLWAYVRRLNESGTTVLLTTHYLEEAEQLCDHIAIIHRGRIIACEATGTLFSRFDRKELTLVVAEELTEIPAPLMTLSVELKGPKRLVFRYQPSRARVAELLERAAAAGLTIVDLTTEEADLEDIFLELTRDEAKGEDGSPRVATFPRR